MEERSKGMGRLYIPDERDKRFPMSAVLNESTDRTYRYWWANGWWGDQGSTSQCVAYSWTHWLEDGSLTQDSERTPCVEPYNVYKEAQKVDQWAGEDYDGTSVRAGAQILKKLGYIKEYRWAYNVQDIARAILTKAPVVVGTRWYSDMFKPDRKGVIKPTGNPHGGHAYLLNGVNMKTKMFRIKNSWGRDWGNKGFAYISFEDMQKLMDEHGEAAIAIEIQNPND